MSQIEPVLALLLGAGAGLGLMLVIAGVRGTPIFSGPETGKGRTGGGSFEAEAGSAGPRQVGTGRPLRTWIIAACVGFVVWLVTGWPAVALIIMLAAGVAPRLFGGRSERKQWIAKTQAIAAWTEMLRDTMAAADGVEEAIAATVPIAPSAIRSEVAMLDARRRSEQPLSEALAMFGAELDHPSADLVVASLAAAAQGEGSDFVAVLTRLSAMTRDEVRMRLRVEASRAKVHTASLIIVSVIGISLGFMLLLSREYFEPYGSLGGQIVLLLAASVMASGLLLMTRMSRIQMPERFSPRGRGQGVHGAPPGGPAVAGGRQGRFA